jgi:signal transduction histidine kinase
MVGGKFSIKSAPGHGTTVSAQIPAAIEAPDFAMVSSQGHCV